MHPEATALLNLEYADSPPTYLPRHIKLFRFGMKFYQHITFSLRVLGNILNIFPQCPSFFSTLSKVLQTINQPIWPGISTKTKFFEL